MCRMLPVLALIVVSPHAILAGPSVRATKVAMDERSDGASTFQGQAWGDPPLPDPDSVAKNRYISFIPANAGQATAVRVRMTTLHRPVAPEDAPDFSAVEGQYRYVNAITMCRGGSEGGDAGCYTQADCDARGLEGTCEQMHTCQGGTESGGFLCGSQEDCDENGKGGTCLPSLTCPDSESLQTTFNCARLGCSPEYRDWSTDVGGGEVLHVVDPSVVPSSRYDVAQLATSCQGNEETCADSTVELPIDSALWGNVDNDPQLNVLDVAAVVDKIKELVTSFIKPRAQLQPHVPDPFANVNVLDVANAVDALKDKPYPFGGPGYHQCIPLRDTLGNALTLASTAPYSGDRTCGAGACHDNTHISNGFHFQQGRTDTAGNFIMNDDFFGDGRSWNRSAGMYGRWSGGSGGFNRQMSAKDIASASDTDLTTFGWVASCGECHVGGGPAEFDRNGERLYGYYDDTELFEFGYERLGMGPGDVALDGDYVVVDETAGTLSLAPWEVTGVADPECLHCHRASRVWSDGKDMHREWRSDVLGTATALEDELGNPVPAFAAAGTAGQGWFSTLDTETDPPVLQIDYSEGVNDGSLIADAYGNVSVPEDVLSVQPIDRACWGCHLPGGAGEKRGMVWFDERDVHFKKFTNRSDEDPANDIPDGQATGCSHCHVGSVDHNLAKGNSPYTQFRNELDWVGFKSCRECHLSILPDFSINPDKDPDAPDVPGSVTVHLIGFYEGEDVGPMRSLSCQACHVPYALDRGLVATDWSVTGSPVYYHTDEFLSADPLDPTDPDKSKWYPSLREKMDSDGLVRFFPQNSEIAIYWADWDRNDPKDPGDDTLQPIILWRLKQITLDAPLAGVADDNSDGKPEVNTPAEMLLYMQALKGNDSNGVPVASNPVLVKGTRVWYEDSEAPEGVNWFDPEQAGFAIEPFEHYGLDHNVLVATESLGVGDGPAGDCSVCHDIVEPFESPVIDRMILVDPFGVDGQPEYETIRELTGLAPS